MIIIILLFGCKKIKIYNIIFTLKYNLNFIFFGQLYKIKIIYYNYLIIIILIKNKIVIVYIYILINLIKLFNSKT